MQNHTDNTITQP